jgi:O-antigen ligase
LLWLVPLGLAVLLWVAPESYRQRAFSSFDLSHPLNQERQVLWKTGLEVWRDHPWTGVGLGDLIPVLQQYAPGKTGPHGHLHNNFVQVLASRGMVGLLAFVWLQLAFAQLLWRTRSRDPETAALLLGLVGSFWGFQMMGLFEWNFGDVEIMIPLYFVLGCVAAIRGDEQNLAGTLAMPQGFQEERVAGRSAAPIRRET